MLGSDGGRRALSDDRLRVERRAEAIGPLLPQVIAIANKEKEALGFLAEGAYREAVARGQIYLMVDEGASGPVVGGFILFGGVYPNARVTQIGVRSDFRRARVGSRLMAALVSDLEKQNYLSIKAKIASDLSSAISFYKKNGFEEVSRRRGGNARNRDILLHIRHLNTPNLFSAPPSAPAIAINIRSRVEAPLYAFDLNVLFDLVRSRSRQEAAGKLFGAALDHRLRLAISKEFIEELRRTSSSSDDPILKMALRLPQLPKHSIEEVKALSEKIHETVFVEPQARGAGTVQAKSDCKHLAHAALARAAAFITSDGAILKSQEEILGKFGLDVASLDELLETLPPDQAPADAESTRVGLYDIARVDADFLESAAREHHFPESVARKCQKDAVSSIFGHAISRDGHVVAFGCLVQPLRQEHLNMIAFVAPEHSEPEVLADYLITSLLSVAAKIYSPTTILIDLLPGQSVVHQMAQARGFQHRAGSHEMVKVALGRPLTPSRWRKMTDQLRRRTGLIVTRDGTSGSLCVVDPSGKQFQTSALQLEELLGPTVIAEPGRSGVIVPIAKRYADDLLGTDSQMSLSFVERKGAALLTRRGYVNAPRTAKLMVSGSPIFFYESGRTRGRGAIVAVARIVDSVIVDKAAVGDSDKRMLVVDELQSISSTEHVLLTTFDNLLAFRNPVPLKVLRNMDAIGKANLISATPVSDANAARILDAGWADE
jgi:ribosomal protein S18 acetylase RimI-like enzyme/predicted nucleic acid-binding protein